MGSKALDFSDLGAKTVVPAVPKLASSHAPTMPTLAVSHASTKKGATPNSLDFSDLGAVPVTEDVPQLASSHENAMSRFETRPNQTIAPEDKGIVAAIARTVKNVATFPFAVAHDFIAPATTPEEDAVSATGGGMAPGTSPGLGGKAALGLFRTLVKPAIQEHQIANAYQQEADANPQTTNDSYNGPQHMANMHHIASWIPMLGPMAANLVERYLSGDKSGAATEMLGYMLAPKATGEAKALAGKITEAPRVAAANGLRSAAVSTMNKVVRPSSAAFEFGREPGAAALDEGAWGLTRKGVLDDVTTALQQKTQELQSAVSSADGSIDLRPTIKEVFDPRIDFLKKHGETAQAEALANVRDTYLDPEVWPNMGKMTPAEATEFKRGVGDLVKWSGDPLEATKADARRNLYGGAKEQINETVPQAAPLNNRVSSLITAKKALETATRRDEVSAPVNMMDVATDVAGGLPLAVARKVVTSPGGMSVIAHILNKASSTIRPTEAVEPIPTRVSGEYMPEPGASSPIIPPFLRKALPASSRDRGVPEQPNVDAVDNREYGDSVTPLGPRGEGGALVRPKGQLPEGQVLPPVRKALPPISLFSRNAPQRNNVEAVGMPETAEASALQKHYMNHPDVPGAKVVGLDADSGLPIVKRPEQESKISAEEKPAPKTSAIQQSAGTKEVPNLTGASGPTPSVGVAIESKPERRQDLGQRQRVDQMSPDQMRQELLTSPATGLPNRRAFDEAQHQPAPAVAMSDADGLKAINDKFGYDAGNELLRAKAEALREAGVESYHDKGDEFLYRGQSPEELQSKLEQAREILRNTVFEATKPDGSVYHIKGADFSYGTGQDISQAEVGLKSHKADREARGERARGELRGITELPQGNQDQSPAQTEVVPRHVFLRKALQRKRDSVK